MTPISFALELLLDCTTIEQVHKRCRKYIKELEGNGAMITTTPAPFIPRAGQAPSTQRILNEMAAEGSAVMPPMPLPKINGGLIDNGDGTKGKRKW